MLQQHHLFFPWLFTQRSLAVGHQLSTQEGTRNGWFLHFVLQNNSGVIAAWKNGNTFPALKSYQNFFFSTSFSGELWMRANVLANSVSGDRNWTEDRNFSERKTDSRLFALSAIITINWLLLLPQFKFTPFLKKKMSWLGRRDVFPVLLDSLHRSEIQESIAACKTQDLHWTREPLALCSSSNNQVMCCSNCINLTAASTHIQTHTLHQPAEASPGMGKLRPQRPHAAH